MPHQGNSNAPSGAVPHVVIVGAGYAGCFLAKHLQDAVKSGKIRLTVIERRESMHHKIGSIRASVQNEWTPRIRIPLKSIVKYGNIVCGDVERIQEDNKTIHFVADAHPEIHFDVLIAATGSTSRSPGDLLPKLKTEEEITEYFRDMSKAIAEANDVVIVGGGASAIEYAGEVRAQYPDKRIRLICANENLLTSSIAPLSSKFLKRVKDILVAKNIELIMGERVEKPSTHDFDDKKYIKHATITTKGKQGLKFETDLVIWAATFTIDSKIYPETWLNEIGEIEITDTFQAKERPDVFAFGDISSLAETKQAITLPGKVSFVGHNILAIAQFMKDNGDCTLDHLVQNQNKIKKSMRIYRVATKATFYLPIGPDAGVSQVGTGFFGPRVFGDAKTREFKGENLYCDYAWKLLTDSSAPTLLAKHAEEK